MANRTMQQKSLKLKRQRRLFPKKLSADYVAVGSGPNRYVMSEYKERTRSLAFDQKYLDWLETTSRFKNKPPGKVEAEKTWERIRDACPSLMNVTLVHTQAKCVKMFFNSFGDQYILYEENYIGRYIRASIRYQSRERLLDRFKTDSVRWVEFVSSSPPKTNS